MPKSMQTRVARDDIIVEGKFTKPQPYIIFTLVCNCSVKNVYRDREKEQQKWGFYYYTLLHLAVFCKTFGKLSVLLIIKALKEEGCMGA